MLEYAQILREVSAPSQELCGQLFGRPSDQLFFEVVVLIDYNTVLVFAL